MERFVKHTVFINSVLIVGAGVEGIGGINGDEENKV